jgi:hypothetical protein
MVQDSSNGDLEGCCCRFALLWQLHLPSKPTKRKRSGVVRPVVAGAARQSPATLSRPSNYTCTHQKAVEQPEENCEQETGKGGGGAAAAVATTMSKDIDAS